MARSARSVIAAIALLSLASVAAGAQSGESVEASADSFPIMTVCREGTWLNRELFNAETIDEGHESWPESAQSLDPESFTDPSFRSIPTPTDYVVVQETLEGFRTEARIIRDEVTIDVRLLSQSPGDIRFQQLSAQHADGQYLGIRGGNVYLRPSDNLAANTLTLRTLNTLLDQGEPLRFENTDAVLQTRMPTEPLLQAFESAESLCQTDDEEDTDD